MLQKIVNINCLMTFLVVGIHATIHVAPIMDVNNVSIELILNRYMNILCDAAVPTFFSISAYLFFLNFKLSDYKRKLVGRFKSLLIPYAVFSILGIMLINGKFFLKEGILKVHGIGDFFDAWIWTKYNPPIWYLLTLFTFVLITPILYVLLKGKYAKLNMYILLILSIISNCCFVVPYSNLFFWFPVIIPFSYLGINKKYLFEQKIFKYNIYIKWIFLLLLMIYPIFMLGIGEKTNNYYLYRMLSPYLILLSSDCFNFKSIKWQKHTFFIYLTHSLVLVLLEHFNVVTFVGGILKWLIVFISCLFLSCLIRKFLPRLYYVLNGGR